MSGLHQHLDELATGVPSYGDLDLAIERVRRDRRRRNGAVAALTAVVTVIAVVVSVVAVTDDDGLSSPPVVPATTPSTTPSPAAWEPPVALRKATTRVVAPDKDQWGNPMEWADGQDTSSAEIDIRAVYGAERFKGSGNWQFRLASRVPADPVGRVVSYGIDVDGDGDRLADCQFGISNDSLEPGDFHVWVTNLRTQETMVQEGPPYGYPVEFSHPAEAGMVADFPDLIQMSFTFLGPHPTPCDDFRGTSVFYAWTAVSTNGTVTSRDFAPDRAWLTMRTVN